MSVNTTAAAASSSTPCRVAVAGASGRMGRMLIEAIRASDDCVLAGALDVPSSPGIGSDACAFLGYASGVAITADLKVGLQNADVLIDFTRPEGTLAHLAVRCAWVSSSAFCASVKPVVPMTAFTPSWLHTARWASVPSGRVKSMSTSAFLSPAATSAVMATPLA